MLIPRIIQKRIKKFLFKGKTIIIYGARQVGKTTLVKSIQKEYVKNSAYFNCDEPDVRAALMDKTSTEIKNFFGNRKLIILDEAQRVKNIGLTLKLMVDNFPSTQIIATGSSSFDLSNKIAESLTGRKYEFHLYPFSLTELNDKFSDLEINRLMGKMMIFGMYPVVALLSGDEEKGRELKELAKSYLYKDALQYQNIKNPEILEKLLQALALQIGNEVSYNELAGFLNIDKNTVANYIRILEQAFIIFRLNPFSRNSRNELKKMRKIYFYDVGIRNAIINNFNPLNLRQDVGALWENFMISERLKRNNTGENIKSYFWRTKQGQEIDYLEEFAGKISGFELKWKQNKWRAPKIFLEIYPKSSTLLINQNNHKKFWG